MIILLVGGHVRGRVLCGGDVVRGLQVARDGVGVPDHVLVADLTRVLHVLISAVKRSIGYTTGYKKLC